MSIRKTPARALLTLATFVAVLASHRAEAQEVTPPAIVIEQAPPAPQPMYLAAPAPAPQPVLVAQTVTTLQPLYVSQPVLAAPPAPTVMRANRGLIAAGAVTLGVSYVPSLLLGSIGALTVGICDAFHGDCAGPSGWLMLPVMGPWLALADHATRNEWVAYAVIDGLFQAGGLALLIAGASQQREEPARANRRMEWSMAPTMLRASNGPAAGLMVMGRF